MLLTFYTQLLSIIFNKIVVKGGYFSGMGLFATQYQFFLTHLFHLVSAAAVIFGYRAFQQQLTALGGKGGAAIGPAVGKTDGPQAVDGPGLILNIPKVVARFAVLHGPAAM